MQVSKLRIYVNIIPNAEKLFLLGHAISSSRILNLLKESIFIRELEIARPNWHEQNDKKNCSIETLTK